MKLWAWFICGWLLGAGALPAQVAVNFSGGFGGGMLRTADGAQAADGLYVGLVAAPSAAAMDAFLGAATFGDAGANGALWSGFTGGDAVLLGSAQTATFDAPGGALGGSFTSGSQVSTAYAGWQLFLVAFDVADPAQGFGEVGVFTNPDSWYVPSGVGLDLSVSLTLGDALPGDALFGSSHAGLGGFDGRLAAVGSARPTPLTGAARTAATAESRAYLAVEQDRLRAEYETAAAAERDRLQAARAAEWAAQQEEEAARQLALRQAAEERAAAEAAADAAWRELVATLEAPPEGFRWAQGADGQPVLAAVESVRNFGGEENVVRVGTPVYLDGVWITTYQLPEIGLTGPTGDLLTGAPDALAVPEAEPVWALLGGGAALAWFRRRQQRRRR